MERRACVARTLAVVGGAFTGRLVVFSGRRPLRPQRVLGVPQMRRKGYPAVDVIAVLPRRREPWGGYGSDGASKTSFIAAKSKVSAPRLKKFL